MKFEKETHDFGKIKTGEKVTYEFKFTNTGKSPLIIKDAVASCGCTKPEWPKTPIKPGESAAIKVTFNSLGKMGLQDKQITITANTNPAQSLVHLIGEVTTVKLILNMITTILLQAGGAGGLGSLGSFLPLVFNHRGILFLYDSSTG